MKYFSIVEFGDDLYVMSGKVDNYSLSEFNPLLELLATMETSEMVFVHCSYAALQDDDADRDLLETEIEHLINDFESLMSEEKITFIEFYDYELNGVLEKPFEDYYELEGEDRENFLRAKQAFIESQKALKASLEAEEQQEVSTSEE